jgi:hypothetical protein
MTKKQLLDLIAEYPDDAEVVIEVHDTTLYEDLYDFTLAPISWDFIDGTSTGLQMHELRLCPIKNTNE